MYTATFFSVKADSVPILVHTRNAKKHGFSKTVKVKSSIYGVFQWFLSLYIKYNDLRVGSQFSSDLGNKGQSNVQGTYLLQQA